MRVDFHNFKIKLLRIYSGLKYTFYEHANKIVGNVLALALCPHINGNTRTDSHYLSIRLLGSGDLNADISGSIKNPLFKITILCPYLEYVRT